ncbi:MAG: hypothetical protein DRN07_02760 [Thermoplasmata archaeon]|nr:MAG: hypothetical protein DRN07_02760 [Thermoplasmata archaeon]
MVHACIGTFKKGAGVYMVEAEDEGRPHTPLVRGFPDPPTMKTLFWKCTKHFIYLHDFVIM